MYASSHEILLNQDALGIPRSTGGFPHFDNQPGHLQIMIRGAVGEENRNGDVEFLADTTDPSVGPFSFWTRSPDDRFINMRYGSDRWEYDDVTHE